jgi:hypothetical protein
MHTRGSFFQAAESSMFILISGLMIQWRSLSCGSSAIDEQEQQQATLLDPVKKIP